MPALQRSHKRHQRRDYCHHQQMNERRRLSPFSCIFSGLILLLCLYAVWSFVEAVHIILNQARNKVVLISYATATKCFLPSPPAWKEAWSSKQQTQHRQQHEDYNAWLTMSQRAANLKEVCRYYAEGSVQVHPNRAEKAGGGGGGGDGGNNLLNGAQQRSMSQEQQVKMLRAMHLHERNAELKSMQLLFHSKGKKRTLSKDREEEERRVVAHFMIDSKVKFVLPFIPKVGSTEWRRIFNQLNGGNSVVSSTGRQNATRGGGFRGPFHFVNKLSHANNHLFSQLQTVSLKLAQRVLSEGGGYTRAVFVREPLHRLVSFYNSLHSVLPREPRLTKAWRELTCSGRNPCLGRNTTAAIITTTKNKSNNNISDGGVSSSDGDGVMDIPKWCDIQQSKNTKGKVIPEVSPPQQLTFCDVSATIVHLGPNIPLLADLANHWLPQHRVAVPCSASYSAVGRFETMAKDAEALLMELKVWDKLVNPFKLLPPSSPSNKKQDPVKQRRPPAKRYRQSASYTTQKESSEGVKASVEHQQQQQHSPHTNNVTIRNAFENVPRPLFNKLIDYYRLDYEMFGYDSEEIEQVAYGEGALHTYTMTKWH